MAVPTLLDADGRASTATAIMMSHHAFRRDLRCFRNALHHLDDARVAALRAEWATFHHHLHGHHQAEDTGVFPMLRERHAALATTLDKLTEDHRQIDPLLERGERAFAELPRTEAALAVVDQLIALLDPHLALEEADVLGFLREPMAFAPENEDQANEYADGFAWAALGVHDEVVDKVFAMLPETLRSKLPAARARFEDRWRRVFGDPPPPRSLTPVPSWD